MSQYSRVNLSVLVYICMDKTENMKRLFAENCLAGVILLCAVSCVGVEAVHDAGRDEKLIPFHSIGLKERDSGIRLCIRRR